MIIEKIKYKLLINIFNKKKKLLWTLMNNLFHNLLSAPTISVLNLSTNTTLGKKNEKIFVTNDSYQTWYIMNDTNFHKQLIDKVKEITDNDKNYTFIDIGANTGLLTKALLNSSKNINQSYLIEPDKDNFFCLQHNLHKYENIHAFNFALDIKEGEKKLYIDKNNKGNLSFNYEMMTLKSDKLNFMNSVNNYEIVKCKSVNDFFNEINNENNLIIKIDVQGYDEIIFQEIPENILKNTKMLFIEITPLKSKDFDREKLKSKLKIFSEINNFNGETFTYKNVIDYSNNNKEAVDFILINKNCSKN
jgi:FkbM family methyltransferase